MDAIDKLGLLAQLEEEFCGLNHGQHAHHQEHPAVDYLIQPFGYHASEIEEVAVRHMIVPLCAECVESLHSEEWTLCYCFECSSSQWIYRKLAKNRYRHSILWLRGCPECTAKFGGLYFTDFKSITKSQYFMSTLAILDVA